MIRPGRPCKGRPLSSRPTRDTSRVVTGQGIVPFDGLRERRVAAGKAGATNEIRTTPRGVCGDGRSVRRDRPSSWRRDLQREEPPATRASSSRLLSRRRKGGPELWCSDRKGIDLSRVPRMPRWLRQPRHAGRAWYYPFTLASGSDPRHESRVALLEAARDARPIRSQPAANRCESIAAGCESSAHEEDQKNRWEACHLVQ